MTMLKVFILFLNEPWKVIQFEDTLGFVLSFAQKSEINECWIVPYQSDVQILLGLPLNIQI